MGAPEAPSTNGGLIDQVQMCHSLAPAPAAIVCGLVPMLRE